MKKNTAKNSNPSALKSMLSLAFYLVLLIGMWAIIGHVAFPNGGEKNTYADLVNTNGPLLAQVAENIIDPEQWAGIGQTPEVQALLEKGGFTDAREENGQALFIIPSEDLSADLSTALVYCPDGNYLLPDDIVWNVAVAEGKSTRYEDGAGSYVTVQQLSEKFYLVESCLPG